MDQGKILLFGGNLRAGSWRNTIPTIEGSLGERKDSAGPRPAGALWERRKKQRESTVLGVAGNLKRFYSLGKCGRGSAKKNWAEKGDS